MFMDAKLSIIFQSSKLVRVIVRILRDFSYLCCHIDTQKIT